MNTMTVVLPNGVEIENTPEGTSKDVIKDKAIKAGLISAEEFNPAPNVNVPEEKVPWYTTASNFLQENMEIPGGVGGALAGAVAGAPFGPPGMVIGGIAGGAAGSAGGSLLSDKLEGEELDYAEAVKEAGISLGFDVLTLGAGKVVRPGFFAAKKALGFSPKETAEQIIKAAQEGGEAGSRESIMASQRLLTERGATLTPYQTNQANARQRLQEQFAQTGLFSSKIMKDNADRVNSIVGDYLNDIMARSGLELAEPSSLGRAMYDIIDEGKSAMSEVYGRGLTEIQQKIGNRTVPVAMIRKNLDNYLSSFQREFGTVLNDDTFKYIENLRSTLEDVPQMKVNSLLDLEKKIAADIRSFGDINAGVYNSTAERELAEFSAGFKDAVQNTLKTVDADEAAKYAGLKEAYAKGFQGLLPEINSTVIKKANKENFEVLGNMLIQNGTFDQVQKFMSSIDQAYAQLGKAGRESAVVKSADQAKQVLKEAYLKKLFPQVGPEFNIGAAKYRKMAEQFSVPKAAARMKAVLGDDYPRVKQIMNLMKEATDKPTSNIGELVLRSKEYAAGGLAVFGGPAGQATAAGVLLGPVFLAKAATNPRSVNKLIAFQNKKFKTGDAAAVAGANLLMDIMNEMSEEDQAEIRNAVR